VSIILVPNYQQAYIFSMKHVIVIFLLLGIIAPSFAQESIKPVVTFSGLVKGDFFFDTRQVVGARDRHFLLWPEHQRLDEDGNDINARSSFNFLAVQSRAGVTVSGIDYNQVKITAFLEGDFFGQDNNNVNTLRLRHAIVRLNWQNTELLLGQYWNPLFTLDCFPNTVSFNTGVPIMPFSRNPQIRLTQKFGNFRLLTAAVGQQKEYTSLGGSETLRNYGIPDMHAQLHFHVKEAENEFVAGIGGSYKTILPSLVTARGYVTNETVSGFSTLGFVKYKMPAITAKLSGILGENLYDVVQISSYAVKRVEDEARGIVSYSPIRNYSMWGEIHTNSRVQFGVFGGFSKNLGTKEDIIDVPASRCHNIDYLWRVAPRLVVPYGRVNFGLEIEHTAAAFGDFGEKARIFDRVEVANTRFLFSSYISF
jgi:hypothetical protein